MRIARRLDAEQICDRRRDIDVVDIFQARSFEVRSGGIEDRFHLSITRIIAMLAEEGCRLKEIADACGRAGVKIEIVAGDGDHHDIAAIVTEGMEIPLCATRFFVVVAAESGFLDQHVRFPGFL